MNTVNRVKKLHNGWNAQSALAIITMLFFLGVQYINENHYEQKPKQQFQSLSRKQTQIPNINITDYN